MAEKKKTTTTTHTEKRSSNYFLNLLAYVAVCVCGVALFLAFILSKIGISTTVTGMMQKIANAIGWIVLCLLSFNFIKNRKRIWMWVVWVVAIVMIIISIFGL